MNTEPMHMDEYDRLTDHAPGGYLDADASIITADGKLTDTLTPGCYIYVGSYYNRTLLRMNADGTLTHIERE